MLITPSEGLRSHAGMLVPDTPDITEAAGQSRLKRWRADRDEAMGTTEKW